VRRTTPLPLLISDGIAEEFGSQAAAPARKLAAKDAKKAKADAEPAQLTAEQEGLAARIKEWRTAEAKRLGVPAYVLLHDRTVAAIAAAQPANPKQLLEIDGMGPAKVEKFGEAILAVCRAKA